MHTRPIFFIHFILTVGTRFIVMKSEYVKFYLALFYIRVYKF